ncbi:homeobox-leucine zipper protein ROC2-like [Typha angustifolia]|uniref:homeobox-leucine zipper protein ROC2-like n=1 Tax=Typha angustifolia TaxID=59011 RepID=UPI003C2E8A0A
MAEDHQLPPLMEDQQHVLPLEAQNQIQIPEAGNGNSEEDFGIPGVGEENFGNMARSDNPEAVSDDDEQDGKRSKKRRRCYHRHTTHQIQMLEAFFKECPHPDDKQRKAISNELGMKPLQVKFWFQNKRTQVKNQNEKEENYKLKEDNERLLVENQRMKEALRSASCRSCGGQATVAQMSLDEQNLRMENAHLSHEIERISAILAKYADSPIDIGMFIGCNEKRAIVELAISGMDELIAMARFGEPMWQMSPDGSTEIMNIEEYTAAFSGGVGPEMHGMKTEATRASGVVMLSHLPLVNFFMDATNYETFFSSIVSKATIAEVYAGPVQGNYNGALQLMKAEVQVPSPFVPRRESTFLRYCKQHGQGLWAVVDVSLDGRDQSDPKCRKRPSGCILQQLPNTFTKVIWIEHVEVEDNYVHDMYKPVVNSGLAFGARRWVTTMDRQCERLATVLGTSIPVTMNNAIANPNGMKNLLKLSERMLVSFIGGITGSSALHWNGVIASGVGEHVRIMSRRNGGVPGRPAGTVLSACTSFRLPVPLQRAFDFLRADATRNQWDVLSEGGRVQEAAQIVNGREQGNCVSILRITGATNDNNIMIIQESCFELTGSYVIYTPIDVAAMNMVLNGGETGSVAILPSGFALLPDGGVPSVDCGGSLLTVAFQIIVDSVPESDLTPESTSTVNSLLSCTCERIKASLVGNGDAQ